MKEEVGESKKEELLNLSFRSDLKQGDDDGFLPLVSFSDPLNHVVEVGDSEEQWSHNHGPLRTVVSKKYGNHAGSEEIKEELYLDVFSFFGNHTLVDKRKLCIFFMFFMFFFVKTAFRRPFKYKYTPESKLLGKRCHGVIAPPNQISETIQPISEK